jgi:hypothetical protein
MVGMAVGGVCSRYVLYTYFKRCKTQKFLSAGRFPRRAALQETKFTFSAPASNQVIGSNPLHLQLSFLGEQQQNAA